MVEGLAGAPVTQEWTGVTSGPGVSRSHLGPMGPAQQPGGARRRPHARWPPPLRARGSALRLGAK